nr:hypothetical protein CFP56_11867 [Quercus suber]
METGPPCGATGLRASTSTYGIRTTTSWGDTCCAGHLTYVRPRSACTGSCPDRSDREGLTRLSRGCALREQLSCARHLRGVGCQRKRFLRPGQVSTVPGRPTGHGRFTAAPRLLRCVSVARGLDVAPLATASVQHAANPPLVGVCTARNVTLLRPSPEPAETRAVSCWRSAAGRRAFAAFAACGVGAQITPGPWVFPRLAPPLPVPSHHLSFPPAQHLLHLIHRELTPPPPPPPRPPYLRSHFLDSCHSPPPPPSSSSSIFRLAIPLHLLFAAIRLLPPQTPGRPLL